MRCWEGSCSTYNRNRARPQFLRTSPRGRDGSSAVHARCLRRVGVEGIAGDHAYA